MFNRIIATYLIIIACLVPSALMAQALTFQTGYVVTQANVSDCYDFIITDNLDIYEIVESNVNLHVGQRVKFTYSSSNTSSPCVLGTQAEVMVSNVLSEGHETELCYYMDCVRPGDANQDGIVQMLDVVSVYLNTGLDGMFRPMANTSFEEQFAPSWDSESYYGVDYKHLDSDGNGVVLEEDIDVIFDNYAMSSGITNVNYEELEGFSIVIDFEKDEVEIEDSYNGENFLLPFSIAIEGDSYNQLTDVVAVNFEVTFSETDFIDSSTITLKQNDPAFFIDDEEIPNRVFKSDLSANQTMDFALASLAPGGKNGLGQFGHVEFIIISDIIGGRAEVEIPFNIRIKNFLLHKSDGSIWSIPTEQTTDDLIFINTTSTSAPSKLADASTLLISPNPAQEEILLSWDAVMDSDTGLLEISDVNGKQWLSKLVAGSSDKLNVSELPTGVYVLTLQTANRLERQQLIVE